MRDKQPFQAINRGLLRACRWVLVLVCWGAAAFFFSGGGSPGFGILLLLVGLWLVLDNPLEVFEIFVGLCPSCGRAVKVPRRVKRLCPACRGTIVLEADRFHDEHRKAALITGPRALEPITAKDFQVEPVVIRSGDTLDLHTFSPRDVGSLLDEFIDLSQKAEVRLVKIIHGKGAGILRRRVHGLLARDPRVLSFYDSPPESGGWGATLVELRSGRGNNGGDGVQSRNESRQSN